MPKVSFSNLKRKRLAIPALIRSALMKNNVLDIYKERPAYQQNDYINWITRAKREETQEKRLTQMIRELKKGNVYMNMKWEGRK